VYSTDGTKIGRAGTVYIADDTGRPEWATVHTGLFGMRESFLPLAQATLRDDRVTVPYDKEQVKDAPNVDPDGGHLSLQEEQRLYDHYGMPFSADGVETNDYTTSPEERSNAVRGDASSRARLRRHTSMGQPGARIPESADEARLERDRVTDVNSAASLTEPDSSLDGDHTRRNR
jgi:hypothetical protein